MAKCDPLELTDLSDYSESTNEKIVVYKVHVFWEGTKFLKNCPLGFDRLEFLLQFEIEVGWYVCVNLS